MVIGDKVGVIWTFGMGAVKWSNFDPYIKIILEPYVYICILYVE